MTKSKKIRRMLAEGKTAKEIAKKLGVKNSYVYTIKWQDKKASNLISEVFAKTRDIRKAKEKNPITTPKQIYDDLKNHFVEPPKDYVVGSDLVNAPPHYTTGGIDFLDYAEAKGLTENAYLFNVVKYVSRAGKKVGSDPLEDLKKAEFYLKREIAARERA